MAMESFHGKAVSGWRGSHTTADGNGVILTAIQLVSSGWRGIPVFTSDRFLCSQATGLVVERRSIGRVFNDRVKVELVGEV